MQWSFLLSMDATSWSQLQFFEVCQQPGVLQSLRTALAAYNKKYPIKIFSGLFIDATATQIDTCRLAALMIEPQMFSFLASAPPVSLKFVTTRGSPVRFSQLRQQWGR